MAHILCITSGLTGILYASFEMVSRLEAAGHQVTYASPKEVGAKVTAQGFNYIQFTPLRLFEAPELPAFKGPFRKIKRIWARVKRAPQMQQAALEDLGMDHFRQVLKDLSPDFLIVDVELHEYIMTAYSMKIPMTLLSQWFSLWKRPGLPPLLHDTIPGKGWQGSKIGIQLSWLKIKLWRAYIFRKKRFYSFGTNRRSILLEYAKQLGFPLKYIKDNYWPGPFTYNTLPVISITAEELEFPHESRPALYYVGPMVYAQRKQAEIDPGIEGRLNTVFEQRKSGKSLIYCSVSTFLKGDQRFLKKIINAVERQDDWMLVLGMGGLVKKDELGILPANVHAFSWVPQLKVLANADCSINHGGIHTINECIHFKVPMLIYSGKRSDQDGCAARVAFHGVGLMADKDKDGVEAIRKNIRQVLTDSTIRNKMHILNQYYQRYQSEQRFLKTIERMLVEQGVIKGLAKEGKQL